MEIAAGYRLTMAANCCQVSVNFSTPRGSSLKTSCLIFSDDMDIVIIIHIFIFQLMSLKRTLIALNQTAVLRSKTR